MTPDPVRVPVVERILSANDRLAERIRTIGIDHVLFATDWPDMTPADTAEANRQSLPLKPKEIERILANQAPYLK